MEKCPLSICHNKRQTLTLKVTCLFFCVRMALVDDRAFSRQIVVLISFRFLFVAPL
jgi:hypothetical protein